VVQAEQLWSEHWQMLLGLFFSQDRITFDYTCENMTVARHSIQKDLGVWFDERLSFHELVQRVTSKGFKSLGFVLRNSKSFKSVDVLKPLYSAFVRSGLEYASTVWAPYYLYAKAGLERV
jgi:hypothetical protein